MAKIVAGLYVGGNDPVKTENNEWRSKGQL